MTIKTTKLKKKIKILQLEEDDDLQNLSTPLSTIPKHPGRELTASFS
jgi:hypothetical protein